MEGVGAGLAGIILLIAWNGWRKGYGNSRAPTATPVSVVSSSDAPKAGRSSPLWHPNADIEEYEDEPVTPTTPPEAAKPSVSPDPMLVEASALPAPPIRREPRKLRRRSTLDVDMAIVDRDAHETYGAIGRAVGALMREGEVERTPEVEAILQDISTLVVYALGTREYRKSELH